MWQKLFENIEKHVKLLPADKEVIESSFRHKRFRKKQYILQEGEICRHESFIIKGCTRTYEVDKTGHEHILQFGLEDWWIGDLYSFLSQSQSRYNIDCLEDCEVLQISSADQDILFEKSPRFERFFRLIIQNAYIALQQRILHTMSKPAAERYQEFIKRYPHIEQRVPDHQIASYLGITPQSLSRIRSSKVPK